VNLAPRGAFLQPADRIARPRRLGLRREAPVERRRRLDRMVRVASRPVVDHPVAILRAGGAARQVGDRLIQVLAVVRSTTACSAGANQPWRSW